MKIRKEALKNAIQRDLDDGRSLRWIAEKMGSNHATLSNLMTDRTEVPEFDTVAQIVRYYKLDVCEVIDSGETIVNVDRLPADIKREFMLLLTRKPR